MDNAQQDFNSYLAEMNISKLTKYTSTMTNEELQLLAEDVKLLSKRTDKEVLISNKKKRFHDKTTTL